MFLFQKKNNNNNLKEEDEPIRNDVEYKNDPNYSPPSYEIESDPNGFLVAFSIEQEAEYTEFFKTFGFVIIRDVLNREDCQNSINDIWNYIESFDWAGVEVPEDRKTIKRSDPKTWELWPQLKEEGILGYYPVFTEQTLKNRSNLNIHKVYSNLLNREDLYINHDRYGFFRPTLGVPHPYPNISPHHQSLEDHLSNGQVQKDFIDYPKWKTFKNLHLDMNPFQYLEATTSEDRSKIFNKLTYTNTNDFMHENNEPGILSDGELHIQGLINLTDNRTDDGGFILVPGFANHLVEWAKNNSHVKQMYGTRNTFIVIPDQNNIHSQSIRITARAGSLVLWNQRTAHGSTFNNSSRPRMAQFVKMFPSTMIPKEVLEKRSKVIAEKYKKSVSKSTLDNLTPQQKKILGIQLY